MHKRIAGSNRSAMHAYESHPYGEGAVFRHLGVRKGTVVTQDLGNLKAAPGLSPIVRDEKRFRFFRRNGKPVMPADVPTTLVVQTSFERSREAMQEIK